MTSLPVSNGLQKPSVESLSETDKTVYGKLLETIEWANKREEILTKDNHTCQHCGRTSRHQSDLLLHKKGEFYPRNKEVPKHLVENLKKLKESCRDMAFLREGDHVQVGTHCRVILNGAWWNIAFITFKDFDYKHYVSYYPGYQTTLVHHNEVSPLSDDAFLSLIPVDAILQVHHLYYIEDKYPWEYRNEALITLCKQCHQKIHQSEKIFVYRLVDGVLTKKELTPCKRCGGLGELREYRHIQDGVCFECNGNRFVKMRAGRK